MSRQGPSKLGPKEEGVRTLPCVLVSNGIYHWKKKWNKCHPSGGHNRQSIAQVYHMREDLFRKASHFAEH